MANLFCIKDRVVIITGGAGILGSGIAGHLAEEGAKVVILDRAVEIGEKIVADIKAKGGEACFFQTDVLNKEILEQNKKDILAKYGRIDALLNAAGGNMAGATIGPDNNIFDLQVDAFKKVVDLNLFGTVLPTMVFAVYDSTFFLLSHYFCKNHSASYYGFCRSNGSTERRCYRKLLF